MKLTEIQTDKLLRIAEIAAGHEARRKLNDIGLKEGNKIYKINGSNGGPVTVVRENGTSKRLIIGRGLASKIDVVYD